MRDTQGDEKEPAYKMMQLEIMKKA